MMAGLWPALLAVILGGSSSGHEEEQLGIPWNMQGMIQKAMREMVYGRQALYWWMGIICFVALAYATNPSESSFRSHLTDLSFHLHLRRLRAHETSITSHSSNGTLLPGEFKRSTSSTPSRASSPVRSASHASTVETGNIAKGNSDSATKGKGKTTISLSNGNGASKPGSNKDKSTMNGNNTRPPPHVLSFSNRVSISLKTPSYVLKSYGLFSTGRILPSQAAASPTPTGTVAQSGASPSISTSSSSKNIHAAASRPAVQPLTGSGTGKSNSKSKKQASNSASSTTTLNGTADKNSAKKVSPGSSGVSTPAPITSTAAKSTSLTSKKSASTNTSVSSKSTSASSSSAPWSEQGGFFIGFLGYWWTIDDGTSHSGIREKNRLNNVVLAVSPINEEEGVENDGEEAEVEEMVNGDIARVDNASPSTLAVDGVLEAGNSSENLVSETTTPTGTESSSSTGNTIQSASQNRQKAIKSLTNGNGNAMFRGGQRRSSPAPPRSNSGSNKVGKKQNSTNNSSSVSGATTPNDTIPRSSNSVASAQATPTSSGIAETSDLLATDADKNLPGLPFHVDSADSAVSRPSSVQHSSNNNNNRRQASPLPSPSLISEGIQARQIVPTTGIAVVHKKKDSDTDPLLETVSTVSHSASGASANVSTITPTAALLQSQLDDLRSSTTSTQARLQSELEDLQSRKRDEDLVRVELKARTKILEENKRTAEGERMEAERKLISARANKKLVEDRVGKIKNDLGKLDKKEKETLDRLKGLNGEREEKLLKLREEVKQREGTLDKEEEATKRLGGRVKMLENEIEDRKLELQNIREDHLLQQQQQQQQQQQHLLQQQHQHHNGLNRNRTGSGRIVHPNAATPILHPPGIVSNQRDNNTARHNLASSSSSPNLSSLADNHTNSSLLFPYPDETPLRPPSPSRTPPGFQSAVTSSSSSSLARDGAASSSSMTGGVNGVGLGLPSPGAGVSHRYNSPFGSSFLEHRLQRHRIPPASSITNLPTSNSNGALYNSSETAMTDSSNAGSFGSFAPFGPASPFTSDDKDGIAFTTSSQANHVLSSLTPPSMHSAYLSGDKEVPGAANTGKRTSPPIVSPVLDPISPPSRSHHASTVRKEEHCDTTQDDTFAPITRRGSMTGINGSSFPHLGSNGPLSPMTPHQTSLIPSQLFDLLDEDDPDLLPGSPSAGLSSSYGSNKSAHAAFSNGMRGEGGSPTSIVGHHQRQVSSNSTGSAGTAIGGAAGPWADLMPSSSDFEFEKPLGGFHESGHSTGATVSRRVSGRNASTAIAGSGGNTSPATLEGASSIGATTTDPIFSGAIGQGHASHGSIGSIGTRSTSFSSDPLSPSLLNASTGTSSGPIGSHAFFHNIGIGPDSSVGTGNGNNNSITSGGGKLSPNDLMFDRARHHALSLNPDAKAFSFSRPLPQSSLVGTTNTNRDKEKEARSAFEGGASGFGNGVLVAGQNPTWASPIPASKGLQGFTSATGTTQAGTSGVRSSSGPTAGSSFSPFDDDDLLRGW